MSADPVDSARQYIEQHRGSQGREAIDGRLIAAGYSQADVERAWQTAGGAPAPAQPEARLPFWLDIVLFAVIWFAFFIFSYPCTAFGGYGIIGDVSLEQSPSQPYYTALWIVFWIAAFASLLSGIIMLFMRRPWLHAFLASGAVMLAWLVISVVIVSISPGFWG